MNSSPTEDNNADLFPDTTARRRTVAMEKNSKSNILADGGVRGMNIVNAVANVKDPSHIIRGDAVRERSRDLSQLRKAALVASLSRRPKKSIHRSRRSRWSTFLSILTMIALLLAAFLYIGQMILRWTGRVGRDTNSSFSALDYEDRISEVEKSLKITAKMLQFQVEVVDKKIRNEIGIVTSELQRQVEEKGAFIEKELKKLESRTDDLGTSFVDLEYMGLLAKEDIEKFWNELKSRRNLEDMDKELNLDEIMALTREIVDKEIEKHAADGLGRVDFALASGGARVVSHSEPHIYGKGKRLFGKNVHYDAQKMLEPSLGEPGQCFALQGSSGFVEIRLRAGIIPDAITLDHVSKSVAYDSSSAPKDCRVSGWFVGPEDTKTDKMFVLAEFVYDLEKSNVQTFTVPLVDSGIINMVRLDFTSNHGSSTFTCIYRMRVHGHEPSSPSVFEER